MKGAVEVFAELSPEFAAKLRVVLANYRVRRAALQSALRDSREEYGWVWAVVV